MDYGRYSGRERARTGFAFSSSSRLDEFTTCRRRIMTKGCSNGDSLVRQETCPSANQATAALAVSAAGGNCAASARFADVTAFLAARVFRATGALAATPFFEGALPAGAITFLVTNLLAEVFFVAVLLADTALGFAFPFVAGDAAFSIRNFVRSLAPAIHAGARPRPLQVAPVFGS